MPNPLETLRKAGAPVDRMPEAKRQVFAELSSDELEVISSVQARLAACGSEVEGQETNNFIC